MMIQNSFFVKEERPQQLCPLGLVAEAFYFLLRNKLGRKPLFVLRDA